MKVQCLQDQEPLLAAADRGKRGPSGRVAVGEGAERGEDVQIVLLAVWLIVRLIPTRCIDELLYVGPAVLASPLVSHPLVLLPNGPTQLLEAWLSEERWLSWTHF